MMENKKIATKFPSDISDLHDERNNEIKKKFPLRKIRLDLCICGHDDSDHQTVIGDTGVGDGECALCVCKGFELPVGGMR